MTDAAPYLLTALGGGEANISRLVADALRGARRAFFTMAVSSEHREAATILCAIADVQDVTGSPPQSVERFIADHEALFARPSTS